MAAASEAEAALAAATAAASAVESAVGWAEVLESGQPEAAPDPAPRVAINKQSELK